MPTSLCSPVKLIGDYGGTIALVRLWVLYQRDHQRSVSTAAVRYFKGNCNRGCWTNDVTPWLSAELRISKTNQGRALMSS